METNRLPSSSSIGFTVPSDVPTALSALLDPGLARRFRAIPVAWEGATLVVLVADLADPAREAALSAALAAPVQLRAADPAALERLLVRVYGKEGDGVGLAVGDEPDETVGEVRRAVDALLLRAVRERASDLHIEGFGEMLQVRLRVDGVLAAVDAPPAIWASAVVSRIKVLAGLDLAETRRPQDGRLRVRAEGREVDLRVSTLPTQAGESVVLRVLTTPGGGRPGEPLGIPADVWAALLAAIEQPHGLVVVAGPTGSGKTTTLYAALDRLNTSTRKVLTVEDPIEYEIAGVTQVSAAPHIGCSFATALRAFLRHDPDVILVGEIRDPETARVAVQAALTGHLVLTTLHAHDTRGALARLLDLGVEPYLLAAALRGVLAQRLLPRLCPTCRRPVTEPDLRWRELGGEPTQGTWAAPGCSDCEFRGRRGRQALFEWLEATADVRRAVGLGPGSAAFRALRTAPRWTLRADAARRVQEGEVALAEAIAAI